MLRIRGLSALIFACTPVCATAASDAVDLAKRCVALEQQMPGRWPDFSTHMISVQWVAGGSPTATHCGGGDATDQSDALGALVDWLERQRPPDRLEARANPQTPWPTRIRPLCPYPLIARYNGAGDPDKVENFTCRM